MEFMSMAAAVQEHMSRHRFRHTSGVIETAKKLARFYGVDENKAGTAALLHDIAREYDAGQVLQRCLQLGIPVDETEKAVPDLLHGKLAAHIARETYHVNDSEILNAIEIHTTGQKNMSMLDKIIFIADMIEPGRDYPGVDSLRKTAYEDLDRAVLAGLESTIRYVLAMGLIIHPNSIEARNSLLKRCK